MKQESSNNSTPKGKVLTYNPSTNTNTFLNYTEKSIHTEHGDMYKVITKKGYSITATDDHSLATIGTDNFFAPLPPQDALGAFVPIICIVDYPLPPKVSLEAYKDFVRTYVKTERDLRFNNMLLNMPTNHLRIIVDRMLSGNNPYDLVYCCKTYQEVEFAKVCCARLGYTLTIEDKVIHVDTRGTRYIPNNGKLEPDVDVVVTNPANPYLRLPYTWDVVVSVEKVPRENTTYDFTVPEFPLFIGGGILVYDTMQLHVPATEEARQEALDKMLPSKNLFNPATMGPMMLPQQEHIFGLFAASKNLPIKAGVNCMQAGSQDKLLSDIKMGTLRADTPVIYNGHKTTAGIAIVNDFIPMQFRVYDKPWNKKVVSNVMTAIGKHQPEKYSIVADTIKELGSLYAYKLGVSYKASDFDMQDLKKKRDAYFAQVDKKLLQVDKSNLNAKQKEEAKDKLLLDAQAFSQKLTDEAVNNNFQNWAYSGSKGKPSQIMQIITSPTVVSDAKEKLVPSLIRTSYLEGLSPSDYWVSSYGTRRGTVGAKLSVAPAGALSKEIMGNVLDVVVSEVDCGTRRGLTRDIEDTQNIINRYEAITNKFIDGNYIEMLRRQGKKQVTVRSPATCECRNGVCQHCFGYNEKLKLPDIGENVGVTYASAITEPVTQLTISTKHSAGTAGGGLQGGFGAIKAFYNMSTKFSGAAVITEVTGTVTKIDRAPAGGYNVYVNAKKYYIPPNRLVIVKQGDRVEAGDPLTDGIPTLSKVVPYKGIDAGRKEFIESASKIYDASGVSSQKKNFEVVARGLINYVEIKDPGDFDDLVIGDIVDYNQLMADIRTNPGKKAPTFVPVQRGTNKAPTLKKDWLGTFGFKYLKGELIENAATGVTNPKHSYHPIGSYARGVGFGKGENGKY